LAPGDRQPLKDGDEIIVGKTFLRFLWPGKRLASQRAGHPGHVFRLLQNLANEALFVNAAPVWSPTKTSAANCGAPQQRDDTPAVSNSGSVSNEAGGNSKVAALEHSLKPEAGDSTWQEAEPVKDVAAR